MRAQASINFSYDSHCTSSIFSSASPQTTKSTTLVLQNQSIAALPFQPHSYVNFLNVRLFICTFFYRSRSFLLVPFLDDRKKCLRRDGAPISLSVLLQHIINSCIFLPDHQFTNIPGYTFSSTFPLKTSWMFSLIHSSNASTSTQKSVLSSAYLSSRKTIVNFFCHCEEL